MKKKTTSRGAGSLGWPNRTSWESTVSAALVSLFLSTGNRLKQEGGDASILKDHKYTIIFKAIL